MGSVNTLIDRCVDLSPSPVIIARLSAMISAGDYDSSEVQRIVMTDESLSAAVLRTANSAAFGVPGRVFDLRDGIVRLGSSTLRRIVMQQESRRLFADAGSAYGLRRQDLWRASVGGALGAELLAESSGACEPGVAYVGGLLRDIGKLAVDVALGPQAFQVTDPDPTPQRGFTERERLRLGVDHAQLGAALGARWGLPERICNAIRFHHDPPAPGEDGADRLTDIVHAADFVCLWAGLGVGDDGLEYTLAEHVRASLGFGRATAEQEIVETTSRFRDLEDSITGRPQRGAA